jgi:dCMP deaminase
MPDKKPSAWDREQEFEKCFTRPDEYNYFMIMAKTVSLRSTCVRRQVGAVAVKDRQILVTAYNGAPSGLPDCLEEGCLRNKLDIPSGTRHEICRAVHCEMNIIIQAALHGVNISGSQIFCTHSPCNICAKMLINAKVTAFYYLVEYSEDAFKSIFDQAGIIYKKLEMEDANGLDKCNSDI